MILGDFFVPLTALIFLRLLWSDCVSFFLDCVFFVFSVSNAIFLFFIFPITHIIICQRFFSYDVIWFSWFIYYHYHHHCLLWKKLQNSCCNLSWMFQYGSLVLEDLLVLFWMSHLHLIHFSSYRLIYLNILGFLLVTV